MKQKIIVILFLLIIFIFFILSFIMPDLAISNFERRKLSQFPKFTADFTEDLDKYLLDQFPFRNQFIAINSFINRDILGIKDYNNVYVLNNNIFEIVYPMNEKAVDNLCEKTNFIISNYLSSSNVYFSAIPDKSYFLENSDYLKMDYDLLYNKLNNINAKNIDIKNSLNIDDYYRTDIHWKQENIEKIASILVSEMNNSYTSSSYEYKRHDNFYGSSYSKAGKNIKADTLTYLYTDYMNNVSVNHLEFGNKPIYDTSKFESVDSYDVFLSGPSSLIQISNPNATSDKELIIFRDSFTSSLAPLLTNSYKKITLVDLRYIALSMALEQLDFENNDVLFLYSTQIINNSFLLKIF